MPQPGRRSFYVFALPSVLPGTVISTMFTRMADESPTPGPDTDIANPLTPAAVSAITCSATPTGAI